MNSSAYDFWEYRSAFYGRCYTIVRKVVVMVEFEKFLPLAARCPMLFEQVTVTDSLASEAFACFLGDPDIDF